MTVSLGNGFGTPYSLAKVNNTHFSVHMYSLGMGLTSIIYSGLNLRVSLPTLEEYVALTPRLVTPVCITPTDQTRRYIGLTLSQ